MTCALRSVMVLGRLFLPKCATLLMLAHLCYSHLQCPAHIATVYEHQNTTLEKNTFFPLYNKYVMKSDFPQHSYAFHLDPGGISKSERGEQYAYIAWERYWETVF